MGIMDKVKAQAEVAKTKAQEGLAMGQAKVEAFQDKRAADGLLRDLGSAYYAQQRSGGSQQAVDDAVAALDKHVAENGPLHDPADDAPEAPSAP